jgi:hypothetical protein
MQETPRIINLEETIGKTAGLNEGESGQFDLDVSAEQCVGEAQVRSPRPGVYRFRSHAEADQWWTTFKPLGG